MILKKLQLVVEVMQLLSCRQSILTQRKLQLITVYINILIISQISRDLYIRIYVYSMSQRQVINFVISRKELRKALFVIIVKNWKKATTSFV